MKLTKSRLKQIIKEELAFLGALETELNFAKKHGLAWANAASILVHEEEDRVQYLCYDWWQDLDSKQHDRLGQEMRSKNPGELTKKAINNWMSKHGGCHIKPHEVTVKTVDKPQ